MRCAGGWCEARGCVSAGRESIRFLCNVLAIFPTLNAIVLVDDLMSEHVSWWDCTFPCLPPRLPPLHPLLHAQALRTHTFFLFIVSSHFYRFFLLFFGFVALALSSPTTRSHTSCRRQQKKKKCGQHNTSNNKKRVTTINSSINKINTSPN